MSFDPTEKISAGGSRLLTTAWSGRQAGPGYYDAVAITRPAGFQMLVMSRTRHAAIAWGARVSGAKAGRAATHEFAGRDDRRPLAICGEPEYSANPNASNLASGDVLMVTRLDRLRRTF